MNREIALPKSIDEYNSWSKRKKETLLEQNRINNTFYDIDDVIEDIRLSNLSIEEWMDELGF